MVVVVAVVVVRVYPSRQTFGIVSYMICAI